jgi:hypothetical protein
MVNLLTRTAWEGRVAVAGPRPNASASPGPPARAGSSTDPLKDAARELVDYMLFVDEAPLAGPIRSSSNFAQVFAAEGPADSKGRSLRQLSLERRMMRYPCSYMIYSEAFEALPAPAKGAVYERLMDVLSGRETGTVYSKLSLADRRAIVEILRETKKGLPESFTVPAR